jgi:hypothetical protein
MAGIKIAHPGRAGHQLGTTRVRRTSSVSLKISARNDGPEVVGRCVYVYVVRAAVVEGHVDRALGGSLPVVTDLKGRIGSCGSNDAASGFACALVDVPWMRGSRFGARDLCHHMRLAVEDMGRGGSADILIAFLALKRRLPLGAIRIVEVIDVVLNGIRIVDYGRFVGSTSGHKQKNGE